VNDNSNSQCFAFFFIIIMFLNLCHDFFIIFFLFYLLILRWLRIWLHNLFLFTLYFYKVSMVCGFAKVTPLALVYEFGGVFF